MEIDKWMDSKLSIYIPILEFTNNLCKKITVNLPLRNLIEYIVENYDFKKVNLYQKQGVSFTRIPQAELTHSKNFVELLLNIHQALNSTQVGINFSDENLKAFKEYYLRIDELPDLENPPIITAGNLNNIDIAFSERPSLLTEPISNMSNYIDNETLVTGDAIALGAKIEPSEDQKITLLYDYFTIHEAACLIANLNSNYDSSSAQLDDSKGLIIGGIKSGKLIADENGEIVSNNLKEFLFEKGLILVGFNDDMPSAYKSIDRNSNRLLNENHLLRKQVFDLEHKLSQTEFEPLNIKTNSISNTDIQNVKRRSIKQANINLAEALMSLDFQNKLRKKDIANFIKPYMKNLALALSDEDQNKADKLVVNDDVLYDNHLKGLKFKVGRQTNSEKNKASIDLLFIKELPISD